MSRVAEGPDLTSPPKREHEFSLMKFRLSAGGPIVEPERSLGVLTGRDSTSLLEVELIVD